MKGKRNANKEIKNKREFLSDIKNKMPLKDLAQKYAISDTTVNKRINEYLGPYGLRNSTGAKEYLQDKNIDDVVKDIENQETGKQDDTQISERDLEDNMKDTREGDEEKGKSKEIGEDEKEGSKEESSNEPVEKPSETESKESLKETDKEESF